jgi:hypothetical protein
MPFVGALVGVLFYEVVYKKARKMVKDSQED